jgi:hypothetical protein
MKVLDSLWSPKRSCFVRAMSGVAAEGGKVPSAFARASGNVARIWPVARIRPF